MARLAITAWLLISLYTTTWQETTRKHAFVNTCIKLNV